MKEKKKSFVLYNDQREHIELLSDDQAGVLLKAIYSYASTHEKPVFEDKCTAMAFSFIKSQMDRDAEKYTGICERRKLAGQKGGRPPAPRSGKANGFSENPEEANKPDNENDTVNDIVTVNDTDYVNENENELHSMSNITEETSGDAPASDGTTPGGFTAPSEKEINAYCIERKKPIDAQAFINYYQSNGWMVGQNPMRDWKAAVRRWRTRDEISGKVYLPDLPPVTSYDLSIIEQSSLALYKDII